MEYKHAQIKLKITRTKSTLFDYSDPYILVKGNTTITRARADTAPREADERKKEVIFKIAHHLRIFKE